MKRVLAAALALSVLSTAGASLAQSNSASARAPDVPNPALRAYVAAARESSESFRILHDAFPAEAEAMVARAMADSDLGPAKLAAGVEKAMREQTPVVVLADDATLKAVVATRAELWVKLRRLDPAACAAAAAGQPMKSPPPRELVAAADVHGAATVRALLAGRRSPVRRGAPTNAQWLALQQSMRAQGVTADQISTLFGGAGSDSLPPAARCDVFIGVMRAIAALPDPTAGPLAAAIYPALVGYTAPRS